MARIFFFETKTTTVTTKKIRCKFFCNTNVLKKKKGINIKQRCHTDLSFCRQMNYSRDKKKTVDIRRKCSMGKHFI